MSIPSNINFASGVTVNITMKNSDVFTGELVNSVGDYLQLKLTVAVGPYVAKQVVLLNTVDILAVG